MPTLEAAAVVRWFDQPILRALTGAADVREVYNELRRFPFVRGGSEEGLALHDAVREIIDENLRTHDSERHHELHERAVAYFEKRLEKFAAASAGSQSSEAERLKLEILYHRIRADEVAGIKLFRAMAEELVQYRLVSQLRALLNDATAYPLEHRISQLWRDYYGVRLLHLEYKLDEALSAYGELVEESEDQPRLQSYALADLGEVLSNDEYLTKPSGRERAIETLETSIALAPVDKKTAQSWLTMAWVYRNYSQWDNAILEVDKAKEFYASVGDKYGLIHCLIQLVHVGRNKPVFMPQVACLGRST